MSEDSLQSEITVMCLRFKDKPYCVHKKDNNCTYFENYLKNAKYSDYLEKFPGQIPCTGPISEEEKKEILLGIKIRRASEIAIEQFSKMPDDYFEGIRRKFGLGKLKPKVVAETIDYEEKPVKLIVNDQ